MTLSPGSVVALAALMALGLVAFVLAGRRAQRTLAAFGLLCVLVGFFPLFAAAVPAAERHGGGVLLLIGSAAVFKLMNRFESAG